MTASDGYIGATHKVVDHGPESQRYNIVVLGDGYRASELGQYATDVDNFVNALRSTAPFNELWCAINVYRIDVVSTDSGADDPGTCGDKSTGSGATPKTFFDATFCGDGNVRRLLTCDSTRAKQAAKAAVAHPHVTMVIVNTGQYGGSGGDVATFSTNPSSVEIGLHEMGHTAFHFADEYEYLQGCSSGETGHDSYTGNEPPEPNITKNTDKNTIKWKAQLTNSADALPTTTNANCSKCDSQANPKAAAYVGAYDGAGYFHCHLYRPQYDCRMRALNNPFCAVCQAVITATINPFKPAEALTLTTPSISFTDIPAGVGGTGVTTYRAIVFEVVTCGTRTFRIVSGPTGGFGTPLGTVVSVSAVDADPMAEARLWISYTSTTAGAHSNGTVKVKCDQTGQTWTLSITANTVARPKSAVALVLDHSGSMSEDAGSGQTKVGKLREAANIFVNAMLQGDALGIVRFDDTAQTLMAVTDVGAPVIGAGRVTAIGQINGPGLDPAGNTSIGAGVVLAKQNLDTANASASPSYAVRATLVLTDGVENTAPLLSTVGSSITSRTFAIGLGQPENISVAALNTLTQGHNGYLLVTGPLTPDQSARLNKYFLQVLAGITNATVILDPHGDLAFGDVHRIPFQVTEADYGVDVFLLSPYAPYVEFALETPDGTLIDPSATSSGTNVSFVPTSDLSYYRMALPALPADDAGSHGGTWNALLTIGKPQTDVARVELKRAAAVTARTLPYDVVVHTYSNLVFDVHAIQSTFEPGAAVNLVATLREYDVPVDHRASVWAEVRRPDGSTLRLGLGEVEAGRFEGSFATTLTGLYTMRVRSVGSTFTGTPFAREETRTAAAYPGGDRPSEATKSDEWCHLLECMLSEQVIDRRLRERLRDQGINLDALIDCVRRHCGGEPSGLARISTDRLVEVSRVLKLALAEIDPR